MADRLTADPDERLALRCRRCGYTGLWARVSTDPAWRFEVSCPRCLYVDMQGRRAVSREGSDGR